MGPGQVLKLPHRKVQVLWHAHSPPKNTRGTQKRRNGGKRNQVKMTAPIAISKKTSVLNVQKTVVRQRELISAINGSDIFDLRSFLVNPGNSLTFPWLQRQALSWEFYRFRRLLFKYIPNCPTTTVGSCGMMFDYDPEDPAPTSSQAFFAEYRAVNFAAWEPNTLAVDMRQTQQVSRRYNTEEDVVEETQFYHLGRFYFVTEGFSADTPIGKLFVEYEVELMVPCQHDTSLGYPKNASMYSLSQNITQEQNTLVALTPFQTVFNNLGITHNDGTFTLPRGNYKITLKVFGQLSSEAGTETDFDNTTTINFPSSDFPWSATAIQRRGRTNSVGLHDLDSEITGFVRSINNTSMVTGSFNVLPVLGQAGTTQIDAVETWVYFERIPN